MTKQEIFDKVVAGLASQGFERSVDAESPHRCMYRGAEGRRCAAGWLIPDEQYRAGLEKLPVVSAAVCGVLVGLVGEENILFVQALQDVHDNGRTPLSMQDNLRNVAGRYSLELPEVLRLVDEPAT